jgi:hypothetical protein
MTHTHNPGASTNRPKVEQCPKHPKNDRGRPLTRSDVAFIEGS